MIDLSGIHGWFDYASYYDSVIERKKSGRFLEIGSWEGKSACYMADLIRSSKKNIEFYCVDLWEINEDLDKIAKFHAIQAGLKIGDSIKNKFMHNVERLGLKDYIIPIQSLSEKALRSFPDQYFDFIFIDAGHAYKFIYKDIELSLKKIKSDGILAGHDIIYWKDVKRALKDHNLKYHIYKNVWEMKKNVKFL